MGDRCGPQPPNGFSPVCTSVRQLAERNVRVRKPHGRLVAEKVTDYFDKIAPRVEHGPGMNRLVASTISLAIIHHLTNYGRDLSELKRFMRAMENGTRSIPDFEADMGVSPAGFCGGLQRHVEQYRTLCSRSYNLSEDSGLTDYVRQIMAGGLELSPLLVNMADFSLPFEQGVQGLPRGEIVSEDRLKLWSGKILEVFFPIADMIGWSWAADNMRRNAVLWHPDLKDKLDMTDIWMRENENTLKAAVVLLEELMLDALGKLHENPDFSPHKYFVQEEHRIKTAPAIVLKENDGLDVMDLVRKRIVFICSPECAQNIGHELFGILKKTGAMRNPKIQDNYRKPKQSGYRAIHITGFLMHGLGIPCEIQIMDKENYENAVCGTTSSRFAYKSGARPEDVEIFKAVNTLLEPVLQAARDITYAVKVSLPVSSKAGSDMATYAAYISGAYKPFSMKKGASVLDGLVRFYNKMGMPIHNAEVFEGEGTNGRKLCFFDECPRVITIVRKKDKISKGAIKQMLDSDRVLYETKVALRNEINGR